MDRFVLHTGYRTWGKETKKFVTIFMMSETTLARRGVTSAIEYVAASEEVSPGDRLLEYPTLKAANLAADAFMGI